MSLSKEFGWAIATNILAVIIIDLGISLWKETKIMSITTILIGFVLIYFTYYIFKISTNEKEIIEIKDWINKKEKILNTMKEIIELEHIKEAKIKK